MAGSEAQTEGVPAPYYRSVYDSLTSARFVFGFAGFVARDFATLFLSRPTFFPYRSTFLLSRSCACITSMMASDPNVADFSLCACSRGFVLFVLEHLQSWSRGDFEPVQQHSFDRVARDVSDKCICLPIDFEQPHYSRVVFLSPWEEHRSVARALSLAHLVRGMPDRLCGCIIGPLHNCSADAGGKRMRA